MHPTNRIANPWAATLLAALLLSATGCGGDDATDDVDQTGADPTTAPVDADRQTDADDTVDTSGADGLSSAAWCDPLDQQAQDWLGDTTRTSHEDLFATDAQNPGLICSWLGDEGGELRVLVHGSPEVWEATLLAAGDQLASIDGLEADHVYEPGRLEVLTPDGATLEVLGFAGQPQEPVDDPDGLARIANAALAANAG